MYISSIRQAGVMHDDQTGCEAQICFNYEAHQHDHPASCPLTVLFVLQCPRSPTASNGNYLSLDVLTAKFKIHTPFNHYSHYPNWRLTLPAKTPVCAPLVGHCQPVQMAVVGHSHHVAGLDSLRRSGSFRHPSLHSCMETQTHTHTQFIHWVIKKNPTVIKTNGRLHKGHFCLESQLFILRPNSGSAAICHWIMFQHIQ